MLTAALALMAAAEPHRFEAEDALLTPGLRVVASRPGFSGKGFVTDMVPDGSAVTWKPKVKPGLYRAVLGFSTPGGHKGMDLKVGSFQHGGHLPDTGPSFARHDLGLVEIVSLEDEVSVRRGWGYYDVDYLDLIPAEPIRAPKPVPPTLIHPKPSREAQALMNRLAKDYGKRMWSGQYEITESDFIAQKTGKSPAILGADFMDYSPSRTERGADPRGATEKWIEEARKGQALTLSWHWNAPFDLKDTKTDRDDLSWYKGFYTNATTFDVSKAMNDPDSRERKALIRDIDVIAKELKKLQNAKVPVLWRPLHEAEGGWFWWGAKGPEPCKWLWRLMVDRLHNHHRLNNLIWVWNSAKPEWHPGDDVVDIVTIDAYPSDRRDPLAGTFEDLLNRFDGKKMIGLAEFPGAPDVERMFRFGARWSYFVSWTGDLGPKSNEESYLKRIYTSGLTANRP